MAPMKVAELWRYPVKSMRGECLGEAHLARTGVAGDREVKAVRDGKKVSARTVPGMLGMAATIDAGGEVLIDGAGWREPGPLARLIELAGDGVELVADRTTARFDAAPVLVTTDGALAALGADRRRFRPNIVISGVDGLAEREWIGRTIRAGAAELAVTMPCERCVVTTIDPDTLEPDPSVLTRVNSELDRAMGVYCEVTAGGPVRAGDPVEIR